MASVDRILYSRYGVYDGSFNLSFGRGSMGKKISDKAVRLAKIYSYGQLCSMYDHAKRRDHRLGLLSLITLLPVAYGMISIPTLPGGSAEHETSDP